MKKALVVDDSATIRTILKDILVGFGYDVSEADDGVTALDWFNKNGPADLTCLDWNMPQMNGIQVVKYVRSNPEYNAMPILMCTSEAEMDRVVTALQEGANEYIMKPFDSASIGEKLTLMGLLH